MRRTVLVAFAALLVVGCGDGRDAVRGGGEPPTKEAYAASVAKECAPLASPSPVDPAAQAVRLREVRDRVRALPTPTEHGAEIRTRFLDPLDRYVAANVEAAEIVTGGGTPSRSDLERSFALLHAADGELRTMQQFFADFGIPECGKG